MPEPTKKDLEKIIEDQAAQIASQATQLTMLQSQVQTLGSNQLTLPTFLKPLRKGFYVTPPCKREEMIPLQFVDWWLKELRARLKKDKHNLSQVTAMKDEIQKYEASYVDLYHKTRMEDPNVAQPYEKTFKKLESRVLQLAKEHQKRVKEVYKRNITPAIRQ